ncbi:hypothetical protein V865_000525 [Kwoniella europaea PYCC6329]|uniref:Cysteine-rich transmembrane domain-containing protein n=1 Tax=Kwoniella europaea PYCC6329 TaxID=1423913 RepID=A0AAX4KAF4_9TREE
MSAKDYYGNQEGGARRQYGNTDHPRHAQRRQQQYGQPQYGGGYPQQGGYGGPQGGYGQQQGGYYPPPPQQSYQQPGRDYPQPQPQPVYVQQQRPQKSGGAGTGCCACLAGGKFKSLSTNDGDDNNS